MFFAKYVRDLDASIVVGVHFLDIDLHVVGI